MMNENKRIADEIVGILRSMEETKVNNIIIAYDFAGEGRAIGFARDGEPRERRPMNFTIITNGSETQNPEQTKEFLEFTGRSLKKSKRVSATANGNFALKLNA